MSIPIPTPDIGSPGSQAATGAEDALLFSASEIYHEASKVRRSDSQAHARILMFNSSAPIRTVLARPLPSYRGKPAVSLPSPPGPETPLSQIVLRRRSAKSPFVEFNLDIGVLSRILSLSCGVTSVTTDEQDITWPLRASPSGGALYPLDAYLVALSVEGVPPGLYLYRSFDHSLGLLRSGHFAHELADASALGESAEGAAACILLVAAMGRTKVKYGERAYRFFLLEAGHIAQNILLAATESRLAGVPVGGFIDDEMNAFMQLDGCTEAVLYMIFIGRT